jgi:hypothetical protein
MAVAIGDGSEGYPIAKREKQGKRISLIEQDTHPQRSSAKHQSTVCEAFEEEFLRWFGMNCAVEQYPNG